MHARKEVWKIRPNQEHGDLLDCGLLDVPDPTPHNTDVEKRVTNRSWHVIGSGAGYVIDLRSLFSS